MEKEIYVNGKDAMIIRTAEAVELAAIRRSQEECPPGLIQPLVCYETDTERAAINKAKDLRRQYQRDLNLNCPPTLIPVVEPMSTKQPSLPYFRDHLPLHPYRHQPSDMELAQQLLERVILVRVAGTLYLFNNRFYDRLSDAKLDELILGVLRDELSISGSAKQIKGVGAIIRAEPELELAGYAQRPQMLCLQNGVLDLTTFQMHEFSSTFFLTRQLDVAWNGSQDCPVFDNFLAYATGGDQFLLQLFWEVVGFALAPDGNRAKRFVIMQGYGDTGKSVFGRLLRSFFKPDAVGSVDIFKMGDRFTLSTLVNKAINISMDLTDTSLNEQAVSVIKQITGGDLVQVEEKYKTPYNACISCKLLYGTNHKLRLNAVDPAFSKRVLYLPFRYTVPPERQNRDLLECMLPERSAILFKALRAYQNVVARGYHFSEENSSLFSVEQAGDPVIGTAEYLELFVRECCQADLEGFVPTETLYTHYQTFCHCRQQESIANSQVFSSKVKPILFDVLHATPLKKRYNGKSCNGYVGLRLVT